MLGNVGPLEIALVLIILLLLFGARRLPELGSGLGRGMREFKESITGEKRDKDEPPKAIEPPKSFEASTGERAKAADRRLD